jgi:hypothetical protein
MKSSVRFIFSQPFSRHDYGLWLSLLNEAYMLPVKFEPLITTGLDALGVLIKQHLLLVEGMSSHH